MPPSIAASIVFLGVSLTLFQIRCGAAEDNNTVAYLQNNYCPTTGTGASSNSDSLYQKNLRVFLDKLPSKAINNSGFYNGSVGSSSTAGSGTVFGMAMCLADIPWPDQCDRCLRAASAEAPVVCSSSSNATVSYRGCLLRYSDAPILAEDFGDGQLFFSSHGADVPETAAFGQTRKDLFTALASEVVVSPLMIASGNRTFNSSHKLYGLAQCSRDLPSKLCFHAITSIIEELPNSVVPWSEGFFYTGFSFYIRYDLTPFKVYLPRNGTGPSLPAETVKDVALTSPSPSEAVKGGFVQRVEIIVSVSIIVLLVLVISIVIRYYQKKQRKNLEMAGLRYIGYGEIKSATNNFDEKHKIGEGGFGKVYKGTFRIDQNITRELAIKCVKDTAAARELKAELKILARLVHRNVVQLVGFCNHDGWFRRGRGLYVCSELISMGPLDNRICASSGHSVIEWPIRYEIIRGICAGLQYLHQDRDSKIVHMDIKPSNILLDDEMKPKIADFGLSRNFLNTKTHTYTKNVRASYGYTAPEFIDNGRASRQCDIYSLGVLILGIVMGRWPPSTSADPTGSEFISDIRNMFDIDSTTTPYGCTARSQNDLKRDASLQDNDCIGDVEKCVGIAFECVNRQPRIRPEAANICRRLNL